MREQSGTPASWALRGVAFGDRLLFDELLGDGGDGAGLQAGDAGQVGARYRLSGSDQFQNEVSINVASDLAGGEFRVGEIDPMDTCRPSVGLE